MTTQLTKDVPTNIGDRLYDLARNLFPLNRSITGQGVRDTFGIVGEIVPLKVHEVPTGIQVFDWTVPKEWNLNEAYIEDPLGIRIVDTKDSNLHVVGYSHPIDVNISLANLRPHLHSLPDHPDWIPYRTSYYKEDWGFCLSQRQLDALNDGTYHVRIDATLEPGVLNYAEAVIPGESEDEFLISAHVCHPSLCNDNLSGIAIAAWLGKQLGEQSRRYTYRILLAPGTIGSIAWMAMQGDALQNVKGGVVAALLGRPGPITYKKTRRGNAAIDKIATKVLRTVGEDSKVIAFSPWGYDERQFNSPGISLDIGRLTRAPEGSYSEYHTSADNLDLVTPETLEGSYRSLCGIIDMFERDAHYQNLKPCGEPQLGKYGLYDSLGGASSVEAAKLALLWVLNLSDGSHSLLDIADRSGLEFDDVYFAASRLEETGLVTKATTSSEERPCKR